MSSVNSSIQVYSGMWDFLSDGGAVSTINLGANLPHGFCISVVTILIINQPTCAGGTAKIGFGLTGIGANALIVNTIFSDYASDNVFFTKNPVDNFNFENPILPNGGQLTMSIFVEALTSGKMVCSVMGTQFGAGI